MVRNFGWKALHSDIQFCHIVGFYSWVVNASSEGAFAVTLQTTTPIGCRTPVHENFNEYCQIWVPLAEDGICPFQPSPDDHYLCGLNVTGFTQYKIQMYGQFEDYMLDSPHRQQDYDSYAIIIRTYGLKVLLSQEEHERTNLFKASFGNLSSGHFIWDGIRIPDLKVYVEIEDEANLRSVSITWNDINSQPEIVKNSEGHVNTSLPVEAIGEFRILRSTLYPVEIQMKTEACPEDNTRVCVCAITFRNVNEIYTIDICDSISREGFLYVGPEEDATHDIFYLGYFGTYLSYVNKYIVLRNGLSLTTTRNYVTGSLEVVIYDGGTLEAFTEMEGIAAFQSGKYRLGDGSYVLDSNGFMESWRYNGDTLLHDYDVTTSVGIYRLDITSTLFENSGDICDFDNLWCAVSVYDVDLSTPLGPTTYGGPFSLSKDYTKLHLVVSVTSTPLCIVSDPGDVCVVGGTDCDLVEGGAFCDNVTKRCACYPMDTVNVNGTGCEGIGINDPCGTDDDCSYVQNSACYKQGDGQVCQCRFGYYSDPSMGTCMVSADLCSTSDQRDCKQGTECNFDKGYCDCPDGFSMLDGECSAVFDRECSDNSQCSSKNGRYVCQDQHCACDPNLWVEEDGLCKSHVGMDCMTTGYYTQVPDATCMPYTGNSYYIGTYDVATCNSGFEEHGNCIWLLGADCTEYEETCELIENARCSIDKICTCKDGYFTPEWDPNNCHKGEKFVPLQRST
ncbi:hypothetical protein MAR_013336 [Mya arenaria]|uniref:Uncharacterized protein n=1 Tax=Mya arenaria TaxID=6604 RepID=A0ABY7G162_MYAAR|nr:hypothetical protein MAR_013336 [Mya arenaria]